MIDSQFFSVQQKSRRNPTNWSAFWSQASFRGGKNLGGDYSRNRPDLQVSTDLTACMHADRRTETNLPRFFALLGICDCFSPNRRSIRLIFLFPIKVCLKDWLNLVRNSPQLICSRLMGIWGLDEAATSPF